MPSFYCENCGREVPAEVDRCPYCGKRFFSVKCPVCSYSGPASEFVDGCPSCGYLGAGGSAKIKKSVPKKKKHIPGWVYWVLLFSMLGAIGVLINIYVRL